MDCGVTIDEQRPTSIDGVLQEEVGRHEIDLLRKWGHIKGVLSMRKTEIGAAAPLVIVEEEET